MTPRLALLLLPALAACGETAAAPEPSPAPAPVAAAPVALPPDIAAFYAARGNRPLWAEGRTLKPEAVALAGAIAAAADHGLDPERYGAGELAAAVAAAAGGDPRMLARADLLLSRAFPAFVRDLRVPAAPERVHYVDEELKPQVAGPRALLDAAAAAPSLAEFVASATAVNPLYASLVRGHARWRAAGGGSAGEARLIRLNLDRARAIPASSGRYVIVDAGSARLWMIDGAQVEGPMRVVVGREGMETPALAGFIRHVTLNPWWNLPPDLARERARRVLAQGPRVIAWERLQILSDWSDEARPIGPEAVDWAAVAAGRKTLRLRQYPGGSNMMGAMKFMLPNELGIYLHDYPDKSVFARRERAVGSGCVRLEDAPRLAAWLFAGAAPQAAGDAPEQDVDLPEPVPVYLTYLTVLPDPEGTGLAFRPDPYGRDRTALAALASGKGSS